MAAIFLPPIGQIVATVVDLTPPRRTKSRNRRPSLRDAIPQPGGAVEPPRSASTYIDLNSLRVVLSGTTLSHAPELGMAVEMRRVASRWRMVVSGLRLESHSIAR
jgi:hypothetical protein